MRTAKTILLSGALVAGLAVVLVSLTAANPPLPVLPGINAKDEYPKGCVDCHQKSGNTDLRIPTLLKNVKGHPDITAIVKVVPDDCLKCHKQGGLAKPLAQIAHLNHYGDPAKNPFVTDFSGQCLNCHAANLTTGVMGVKSGPKNW